MGYTGLLLLFVNYPILASECRALGGWLFGSGVLNKFYVPIKKYAPPLTFKTPTLIFQMYFNVPK